MATERSLVRLFFRSRIDHWPFFLLRRFWPSRFVSMLAASRPASASERLH